MKNKAHFLPVFALIYVFILNITASPILSHQIDQGTDIGDVVFLGDSTTYSFSRYGLISDENVWTGLGNTLSMWDVGKKRIQISKQSSAEYKKILSEEEFSKQFKYEKNYSSYSIKLFDLCKIKQPKIIVITLGINGIKSMSDDSFICEYSKLIETINEASPGTLPVLCTVLPVAERSKLVTNEDVEHANELIRKIAEKYSLEYIDTYGMLKSEERDIDKKILDCEDGIHYSGLGCKKILNYIENELKKRKML